MLRQTLPLQLDFLSIEDNILYESTNKFSVNHAQIARTSHGNAGEYDWNINSYTQSDFDMSDNKLENNDMYEMVDAEQSLDDYYSQSDEFGMDALLAENAFHSINNDSFEKWDFFSAPAFYEIKNFSDSIFAGSIYGEK